MKNACFRVARLECGYGGAPILRNVSAAIPVGAVVSLIGPNGSGKSTLLKALAGLLPYKGELSLMGRDVRGISRREMGRLVGFLPQNFRSAYPFPVWEVIGLGRLPHQGPFARARPEDDERVLAAARLAGVEHLLPRLVTFLSGGEAQRVSLACVLAQDPPVLLLDEPTSAQDPGQAARVLALLRGLGRTVVAAVHDVNAALAFSDGYIALRGGTVCFQGPMESLDGDVLQALYGTPFRPYQSRGGDVIWRALAG